MPLANHTAIVKKTAADLGFSFCGIAKAGFLNEDAKRLENWLKQGMHGNMHYMENHFEKRVDPSQLVPGAKSVITLLQNYFPAAAQDEGVPKISKYAFGDDYHDVIRKKLDLFFDTLQQNIGKFTGRGFVDSAPVLERAWAVQSNLGWVGKNGNLLTKTGGSYFFIASLIVDVELDYDTPYAQDYCGNCTRCIDACPTDAILPHKVIDGSKCISYYTIELKEALMPAGTTKNFDNWLFGCDVCQDVCPWNRFAKEHREPAFTPLPEVLHFTTKDWEELTEEKFKIVFADSPIKRTKFGGIQRNLKHLQSGHSNTPDEIK